MLENNKIDINTLCHFCSLLIITWVMIITIQTCLKLKAFSSIHLKGNILFFIPTMHALESLKHLLCPLLFDQLSQQLPQSHLNLEFSILNEL